MKAAWLRDYEVREREIAHGFADRAVHGQVVVKAEEIYRDRLKGLRLGFHRHGAPLVALLYLYEQTVVFVPPTSQRAIEQRFGISWQTLLDLAASGALLPIVGHPEEYAGAKHFDALFELNPPSVWARGDELSLEFANGREYWAKAHRDFDTASFTSIPWVRHKYGRQYPRASKRELNALIDTELKTNYVDLCIYGWEPLASSLITPDLGDTGVRRMLELSELLTYPSLIGLGGTPSYGFRNDLAIRAAQEVGPVYDEPQRVPLSAPLLLEGLGLTVPERLNPSALADFHTDGMSRQLWRALDSLESELTRVAPNVGTLDDRADAATSLVRSVLQEVNSNPFAISRSKAARVANKTVDLTVKLGSVPAIATLVSGPLGHEWLNAGLVGAEIAGYVATLRYSKHLGEMLEEKITTHLATDRHSPLAAQLWWLSNWKPQV